MSEQTLDMLFPLLREMRAEQATATHRLEAQIGVLAQGQVSIRAELKLLRDDINDMRNAVHEIAIAVDSHSARLDRIEEHLGLGSELRTRISIFLNVFDVHVNRMPADGTILSRIYRPGKFVNAAFDKASVDNERMALVIKLADGHAYSSQLLGCVQIAGLVARRIICDAREGNSLKAGQRYGLIRFGSRADIYLPPGLAPQVVVGQYMTGGETVLADCASTESARLGEVRQ